MRAVGHFKTITKHKLLVMQYCFRVGLIRQGLLHDLSKYSWSEFRTGAKYYTGDRSPNAVEREILGYSPAWLHHKGRNRHHLEYWMDFTQGSSTYTGQPMPTKYMVELCLDRIAACRVYHGDAYTDQDPLEYLNHAKDVTLMHPDTRAEVTKILSMLAERGEEYTLRYIRDIVLADPVEFFPNLPQKESDPGLKDKTFLTEKQIESAANRIPTPFYIYSEERIRNASEKAGNAFSWNKGYRQFFPVKATPTAGILKLLHDLGQGVVCSTAAELDLSVRCGFDAEDILFLPNFPSDEDIAAARAVKCGIIIDSEELLDRVLPLNKDWAGIGVRVTPEAPFRFGNKEIRTEDVKFGCRTKQMVRIAERLMHEGVDAVGLHGYLSGNTLSGDYYPKLASLLADLAVQLHRETGIGIAYLNISGGAGIPYEPEEPEFDMEKAGKNVLSVYQRKLKPEGLDNTPVYTELGRYITGPAGIMVTRVTGVKRTGQKNYAGVDASSANLMRPMLYGAYHHMMIVGKSGAQNRSLWDVVGSVAENTDKLAVDRLLPDPASGDLAVFMDVGAHCHSMGYQYGGHLRCAEYLLTDQMRLRLLRRGETVEDYIRTQTFEWDEASEPEL